MAGLQTYKPLQRRGRLAAVPDRPAGQVVSFADAAATREAKAGRRATRAADRAELAAAAAAITGRPVPLFPDGPPEELDAHFPAAVRALIIPRFQAVTGTACDLSGFPVATCWGQVEAHHVQPIGMGGLTGQLAAGLAVASNGQALCTAHHMWVHNHKTRAEPLGLLSSKFGAPPPARRVSLDGGATWYLVDNTGDFEMLPPDAA